MGKSAQKKPGEFARVYGIVGATELKVSVKRFVAANLTRLLEANEEPENISKSVGDLVMILVNEGLDELVASLNVIKAMNEKRERGESLDA